MILYAESSAVLSWLLDEPSHSRVIEELGTADRIATSVITVLECSRALARARHAGRISAIEERAALHVLDEALESWHLLDVSEDVIERARAAFPAEPVRSLDAVHLASAWSILEAAGEVTALSLDERVRSNALAMGMRVVPATIS
jgi:predicted nucleic acid-binding protein